MNRKTIALLIILFVASNALSFMFGAQYNTDPLVLNVTNQSNDSGLDTGFNDNYIKKDSNTTKKKNTTSNSTVKKNKTSNVTNVNATILTK